MASTPYIVLISGAGRGLGKGLLERYLARPNHIVIAANRDPTAPTSKALHDLPKGDGSRLIVVKYDGAVDGGASEIPNALASEGINHLDLVIANAGIAYINPTVAEVKISDLENHMAVNAYGTVRLYQATLPLLKKAQSPKWVTIGSAAGTITDQIPFPNAAYGPTKAAVHWLTKRINGEEERLTAFVIDPGFVDTDMGKGGVLRLSPLPGMSDLKNMLISPDESVTGMVQRIDEATKATHGGVFVRYDGSKALF